MKVELQIKETYEEEKLIVQTPQPTEKVQKVMWRGGSTFI